MALQEIWWQIVTEFYLHNGLKVLKLLDIVEESLAFKNCLSLMSLLSPYFHEVYPNFEKTPHALRDMKAKRGTLKSIWIYNHSLQSLQVMWDKVCEGRNPVAYFLLDLSFREFESFEFEHVSRPDNHEISSLYLISYQAVLEHFIELEFHQA